MNGEMITVEYAGHASRQVGNLPMHDVRAWWVVRDEGTIGRVKLAAGRELKRHTTADHVEYATMDMNTYNSPHLDAMITFRVLTHEQFTARAELRKRVYSACDGCGCPHPGEVVRVADGAERALCFTCRRTLTGPYQVLHWIKANGKVQA